MKQADIFVEEVVSFVSDELEMESFRKSLQQFLLNEAAAAQLKKCIDDVEQESKNLINRKFSFHTLLYVYN